MHKSTVFHPIFEHEDIFLYLFLVKNEEDVLTKRRQVTDTKRTIHSDVSTNVPSSGKNYN